MNHELTSVLEARSDYGSFADKAEWIQLTKANLRSTPSWGKLTFAEQEALEAIIIKAARILYGKPVRDNWLDIAGYATLALEVYDHE